MFRTIDRYLIRETLTPFLLVLLVLTFMLEIPPIVEQGEKLLTYGAPATVVAKILLTLVPQALAVTIPMSLLFGLLVALGRLSADREIVALQACGVGLRRLLAPVGVMATAAAGATLYLMLVAVPQANQAFRVLTHEVLSSLTASEIRPHVFFQSFPGRVLYVGDGLPDGGWRDVFLAETGQPDASRVYTAARGALLVDNVARSVQLVLQDGQSYLLDRRTPDKGEHTSFERVVLTLDPSLLFPRQGPLKGEREMTIPELRARIAELDAEREKARAAAADEQPFRTHSQVIAIHQKFAIPAACFVFALIAIPLGVSTRKEGKFASFVLGAAVVFAYYVVMSISGSLAKGQQVAPALSAWLANLIMGVAGMGLFVRRMRGSDRPIRIALPFRRRGAARTPAPDPAPQAVGPTVDNRRAVLVIRLPRLSLPGPTILDRYVARTSARTTLVAGGILLGLFHVASFIDLSDKLFKGQATGGMIASLLWYSTPQYVYYIIPIAVLIGTLVTIGAITRTSELVVMKACGISLYRVAAPLLVLGLAGSACVFALDERVLAFANRRADALNNTVRGRQPHSADSLNRRWLVGRDGNIYNYVYFDRDAGALNGVSIYEFEQGAPRLARVAYLGYATQVDAEDPDWDGREGWIRQMAPTAAFERFETRRLRLEPGASFAGEEPDAELMSYSELREYVTSLRAGGFDVAPYVVALHRKLAFPFVTLVMALIAVPFAVTTGKRGTLYGVGAGLILSVVYWMLISLFAAIGSAGLLAPLLAAWAPNILFAIIAVYLTLTVRT